MSKIRYYYKIYRSYGMAAVLFLLRSKFKKNKTGPLYPGGVKFPITLSNFSCDVSTLFKIFYGKEYDIDLNRPPAVIIDCGANIGLSAVFFAAKYPDAQIIAIEPDKNNFRFLELNTKYYKNVICLEKAVWSGSERLNLTDPGSGNWGLQTSVAGNTAANVVDAVSIDELISTYRLSSVDLIKIDIEGAEKEIFAEEHTDWLEKTKAIAIELHEFLDPTIPAVFHAAIAAHQFNCYNKGENLICQLKNDH